MQVLGSCYCITNPYGSILLSSLGPLGRRLTCHTASPCSPTAAGQTSALRDILTADVHLAATALSCLHAAAAAGESQACAAAAKERIEVLEQEAEAAAAEHQQALEAAAQQLKEAHELAAQQLKEAQEVAASQLQATNDQHESAINKVQAELSAVKVREW